MDLILKATELRLGLPGCTTDDERLPVLAITSNKRSSHEASIDSVSASNNDQDQSPPSITQVVGWPPIRSYRKNNFRVSKPESDSTCGRYVKVSMDGVPYLRKIDLNVYRGYSELLKGLQSMFKITIGECSDREGYGGSDYAPTYQDKDGDWMLVGDVPWDMFITSCKRLRIMKGSEARGLASG